MKTMCIMLLAALFLLVACSEPEAEFAKDAAWTNEESAELESSALKTAQSTNLSAGRRNIKNFYMDIPANAKNLKITTSGGSGDVDLYVRHGSRPAGRSYDCRSASRTNKDACSFAKPKKGRYHITLYAAAAYRGVTLKVTFDNGVKPKPAPTPPAPTPPAPTPPAPTNGYSVQAVYVLPKNAPNRNRSALMLAAAKKIQKQWAGWGWTFALKPNIVTLELPGTCESYSGNTTWRRTNPAFVTAMKKRGLYNNKTKYVQFIECVRDNSAAAWGGGNQASLLQGVVANILRNDNGVANRSSIGAVGHELGHTFGFPHENCKGDQPNNHPTPSLGPMCNGKGNWPNVSPAQYQRDLLWRKGCNWIRECQNNAQSANLSLEMEEYLDADTFLDSDGNIIWKD